MSFKIFSLQLSGKIKPVEKIEQEREKLLKDYEEFIKFEKSDELAEYVELETFVNSDEFRKIKSEIEKLEFKGSNEFKLLEEFEKLKKAKHIKKYFVAAGSADLKKFESIKDSEKLKEYDALYEYMNEGQFQRDKKEVESQIYKGSVEEKHETDFIRLQKSAAIKAFLELSGSAQLKKHENFESSDKLKKYIDLKNSSNLDKQGQNELKRLKKDAEIKGYFKFENSKKLKLYKETTDSHDLKRYNELKEFVDNPDFREKKAFLKDKKKFEKTEAFKKQQNFKKLAADGDIRFFLKYNKSAIHKNYLDVKDSFDLKRFNELKEITSSKEFLERKAYLEDKKKWEKTEAFDKQQKYLELKKMPRFVKFFKYSKSADFDFLKNWEIVFQDNFSGKSLDTTKWSNQNFWVENTMSGNFSMPGDLSIFSNGKNVKSGGKLIIEVKKEKIAGKVWKMPGGFVPTEFDYSSDLVSSHKSYWQSDGIFEAKIKFDPEKEVISSFILQGEKNFPAIHLLEMGMKNRIGISSMNGKGKLEMEGLDISNLKKGKSYIFSVEKSGRTFTWKINETEVLKLDKSDKDQQLHLNASTMVIEEISGSKLPVKFEIDWVKCYHKK